MIKTLKVLDFTIIIENIVSSKKMTYWDAICHYCEETQMEPQTIGKLVQGPLKAKLREEKKAQAASL